MKFRKKTGRISWKHFFISLAVLIGLSIITIYIILYNYDLNNLKPRLSKLVEDATGRQLVIKGNIHLRVSLAPRVIIEDIALKNAAWGSEENMIHAKRLKLQVALLPLLSNKIFIKQLIISEPDIHMEISREGESNFAFKKSSKPIDEKPEEKGEKKDWPIFASNKITIENGQFTHTNLKSKETYTVKIKRMTLLGKDIEAPVKLNFYVLYNNRIVTAQGIAGPLPALSDPSEKFSFDMVINAGGNFVSVIGGIQDTGSLQGVSFTLESKIWNTNYLEELIGQSMPIKEPFEVSGRFAATKPNAFTISDISFSSQHLVFNGSIDANIKTRQPEIKAIFTAEKLDLTPLMPTSTNTVIQESNSNPVKKKSSRVFSSDPLPDSPFNTIDIDLKLEAASIDLPGVALQNLSIHAYLTDGQLNIKDFKTQMGSGILDGNIYLYPEKNTWLVETAMKVEHLPLDQLIPAKKVTDSLEGDIDMIFSLSGQGKSISEIMGSLDGDFGLSMCDGKISTKYIDLLGADFSTSFVKLINPVQKKSPHTDIKCFVCILDINKGVAKTKALVLDTGPTLTVGKGRIDFATEKLNITLKPVPKGGLGINKVGRVSLSLAELYKPVKISGTLSRPKLAIDLTQTAITLTKVAGGVALLGPAGVALALVTGSVGDDNPCLSAVEAVKKGSKEKGLKYDTKEGIVQKTANSITERLKKLFGFFMHPFEKKTPV